MLSAFASAFRTPDLRNKLLFTLGIVSIFRLGSVVPTPGVDYKAIRGCIALVQDQSVYGLINLFSGGALLQLSVFALGIMPYITASIILQLLTVVVPTLEKLQKEGELGRRKITQWTRYLTVGLSIVQSFGAAKGCQHLAMNLQDDLDREMDAVGRRDSHASQVRYAEGRAGGEQHVSDEL